MDLQERVPLGPKTTMRIGGAARWYGEPVTREDVEAAATFAHEKDIPLILLGAGSNTVFADGVIEALVVRIKADSMAINGNRVTVKAGKILGSLLHELAEHGLDLSPLTGIPGTLGGAIFGNAGQGIGGIWIDAFVADVTAYVDEEWRTFARDECGFRYRQSVFKDLCNQQPVTSNQQRLPPIIWEATLDVPSGDPATIAANIEALLQKRIETQPHLKTAGSCFKSLPDGTPAWKLIDAAGLRGHRIGGIEIAPKHANFLLNVEKGTYVDIKQIVETVKAKVPSPLEVEMRFIEGNGSMAF